MEPWMHPTEIAMIEQYLGPDKTMLEWGSGGSTLHFAPQVKAYYSIEHDKKWYNKLASQVDAFSVLGPDITYRLVKPDVPHIHRSESRYEHYRRYINESVAFGTRFDVVLIDGRCRVECAKHILRHRLLKPGGVVIVHDFWKKTRAAYRILLEDYQIEAHIQDTRQGLVVLKPREVNPLDDSVGYVKKQLTTGHLFDLVQLHLDLKIPLSMVRFGDGEHYVSVDDERAHQFSYPKHLGYLPDFDDRVNIAANVQGAIQAADVVGLHSMAKDKWQHSTRYFLGSHYFHGQKICRANAHLGLLESGRLDSLIESAERLVYVSGHNLTEAFMANYPNLQEVRRIAIPKQHKYFGHQIEKHYPDVYDAVIDGISKLDLSGWLGLVGAGFVGKQYPIDLADQGAIALDIGSVFDRWAGHVTRGPDKGTLSDEYKLAV